MRRPIEWIEKLPDSIKRKVRVTLFGKAIKWQFQLSDAEGWDYDTPPSAADWDRLIQEIDQRYHRRRASCEDLALAQKCRRQAGV